MSAICSITACGAIDGSRVGQLHGGDQISLILLRNEADRHRLESEIGQHDQADINRPAHSALKRTTCRSTPHIARPAVFVEGLVEQPEEPAEQAFDPARQPIRPRVVRLEQQRRQRGAERQRIECREQRGKGNRQRELPVKLPGDPADERHGNEHRRQAERDGDDRRRDFVHRPEGRVAAATGPARSIARRFPPRRSRHPRRCRSPAPARRARDCSAKIRRPHITANVPISETGWPAAARATPASFAGTPAPPAPPARRSRTASSPRP